ncbi:hypothetical protein S40293_09647 [Stachybotrys chartarum IBT 40293]|nr:hypothetical protein S40293_09647 [Stachybotrys chartarum IBT 40293]
MAPIVAHGHVKLIPPSPPVAANEDKIETPENLTTDKTGEESDGDLDHDIFIVETIKNHVIAKNGNPIFLVKWKGFESKKDLTWEPEDNLTVSGDEILNEYYDKIGGRDKLFEGSNGVAKTTKRRLTTDGTLAVMSKRLKETEVAARKQWIPPSGSWEDEVETINACEQDNNGKLVVFLIWKNGQKTKHGTQVIYKKCPQKMLQFYEQRVKIIRTKQ